MVQRRPEGEQSPLRSCFGPEHEELVMNRRPSPPGATELPFPTSLCHSCAAPPRYIKTQTSTFILCPLLPRKYPQQPVVRCALYQPSAPSSERDKRGGD
jgi:hypothetical protein